MADRRLSDASGSPCTTKVCRGGWHAVAQPGHQFVAVGVARQAGQVADLGAHRHVLAVDLDLGGAGHQARAAAAADLEAGKHTWCRGSGAIAFRWCSTRPPVAMPLAEMMSRPARAAQPHRLLHRLDQRHAVDQALHLARRHTQQPRVPAVQRGGFHGHRAVEEDRQCRRDAPRRFSRCSSSSSACARPTANDGISTEPPRSMVRLTMSARRAAGSCRVGAVAVGRLDDQHVGPRHGLRAAASAGRSGGPGRR
jgi:hypothetical protein